MGLLFIRHKKTPLIKDKRGLKKGNDLLSHLV